MALLFFRNKCAFNIAIYHLRGNLRKNLTRNLWYARIDKLVYSGNTNIVIGRDRSHESTSNFRMHRNKVETLCYN